MPRRSAVKLGSKLNRLGFRLWNTGRILEGVARPASICAALLLCFVVSTTYAEEPRKPINIVLVHGIFDRGKIFDPMVRVLTKEGYHCFAPSLTPNDCRHGVRELSLELSEKIDARFGKSQPIILIAFSMGGLITRDYVQNVAKSVRMRGVFLISTPNHGTLWASLSPGDGVKQLSYNSRFIRTLNQNAKAWNNIPVCSYWTPYDLMILPARSSLWTVGDSREVLCPVHPWMVRNEEVVADITARIALIAAGKL